MRIGIFPDVTEAGGERMSFSERWAELGAAAGIDIRLLDPYAHDMVGGVAGCAGVMWRFHRPARLFAKRLLPAIHYGLGIPVYPDLVTCWYYDDKLAMHYALRSAQLATPRTWAFWRQSDALAFGQTAEYPLVLKLAVGFGSNNVMLVRNKGEFAAFVDRLFDAGLFELRPPSRMQDLHRHLRPVLPRFLRALVKRPKGNVELQRNYLLVQEFLPDNPGDTRVTVIGDRAFGFRRSNRPGDFRASGSGLIDHDPRGISEDDVRLAFKAAHRLHLQSVGVDLLQKEGKPVIVELGYDYVNRMVNKCPGHWVLRGDPDSGVVKWIPGATRSEDVIFEQFVAQLRPSPALELATD